MWLLIQWTAWMGKIFSVRQKTVRFCESSILEQFSYYLWSMARNLCGTDSLFILCINLFDIKKHLPSSYGYADDTQLYIFRLSWVTRLSKWSCCSQNYRSIYRYKWGSCLVCFQKLKFADSKTESLITGTCQQLKKIEIYVTI